MQFVPIQAAAHQGPGQTTEKSLAMLPQPVGAMKTLSDADSHVELGDSCTMLHECATYARALLISGAYSEQVGGPSMYRRVRGGMAVYVQIVPGDPLVRVVSLRTCVLPLVPDLGMAAAPAA